MEKTPTAPVPVDTVTLENGERLTVISSTSGPGIAPPFIDPARQPELYRYISEISPHEEGETASTSKSTAAD